MRKSARDKRPYVRPVTKLELSEKNVKFRWIAIVVLLAIAVVSIGYGISAALSTEPGWQQVTVQPEEVNCSADFVLMYNFGTGSGGTNPTMQAKQLEAFYGALSVTAYELFSPEAVQESGGNLQAVNANVNKAVRVDPALYAALEVLVRYDNRHVFLAPVTKLYEPVFLAQSDGEAGIFDPMQDPELAEIVTEHMQYCADADHVALELLGDDQVRLTVSDAYLEFAEENEIEVFLDFGWMVNAFIADYMADALSENGFTYGYLASYDGFTRNLDITGESYGINLFDRQGNSITMPARLSYSAPGSIVFLRDYPMSEQDRWHYYVYETGNITTVFLDSADGISKSATDSLMAYSAHQGCGEILAQIAPLFTDDALDTGALAQLANDRVYALWTEGNTIFHTQEEPAVALLSDSDGEAYSLELVE